MQALILVRYGEIALKGKNRGAFEKQLQRNLQAAVKSAGGTVERLHGRFMVKGPKSASEEMLGRLKKVCGVTSLSPVEATTLDLEAVKEAALSAAAGQNLAALSSFKVSARRANKKFALTSPEICRLVGAHLLKHLPGLKVDLEHPDFEIAIEIGYREAYVYLKRLKGPGGLPVGIAGRALLLLSGGIDSPAAGYLAMKRGLKIEALHFNSFPFTGKRSLEKAKTLSLKLAAFGGAIRFHTINVAEIQKELRLNCKESLNVILLRRMMMRLAEMLALKRRAKALITGDSLGQVASQTMESLDVVGRATDLLIIRPLLGFDKHEIVNLARTIDTYETSILPYEDCCTLFVPKNPVTRPKLHLTELEESHLDLEQLLANAFATLKSETLYHEPF